jgi:hypothetical protein
VYRIKRNDLKRDTVVQGLLTLYVSARYSWQETKVVRKTQASVSQDTGSPAARPGFSPRGSS